MVSVDVVVPCYQYGRFLRSCVESVLAQEVEQIRVLIVDNASSDNSLEEAQQLAAEEHRVEFVAHRSNLGPHASFNEGIDWAEADYLLVLCADDLLTPGSLNRALSVMEDNATIAFALGTDIEYQQGGNFPHIRQTQTAKWRILTGYQFIFERCSNPAAYLALGAMLVRTQVQKKAGYYRQELPFTDDLEMALRLARLGSVAETSAVQGIRRLHKANESKRHIASRTQELAHREAAIESFFAHEGAVIANAERLRGLARRRLAERAYWWGARELSQGFGRDAFDLFRFSFARSPIMMIAPPVGHLIRSKFGTTAGGAWQVGSA